MSEDAQANPLVFAYFTQLKGPTYDVIRGFLEKQVENPDKGSKFEAVVNQLGNMPTRQKMDYLMQQGFDALLCMQGADVAGYLAIRRDEGEKTTHIFRIQTEESHRGNGIAVKTLTKMVNDAFDKGHSGVRLGVGKNTLATACLESLKTKYEGKHKIEVDTETGYIHRKL